MAEYNSLLGLKIMDLLREHSDEKHPLTQQKIVELLRTEYGTKVDRKTISRNINPLVDYDDERHIGYKTAKRTVNGEESEIRTEFYYKSDYEEGEMQVLFDSILSNRHISMKYTKDLIEKISENNKWFKKKGLRNITFYDSDYKQEIPGLFLNTEKIMEAIENKRDILICEYEYDEKLNRVAGRERRVSPVRLFMYEQTYYLLAIRYRVNRDDNPVKGSDIEIFRVADIKVEVLEGTENNAKQLFEKTMPKMDFTNLQEIFPYMEFTGEKSEDMTFVIPKSRLGDVVARFGKRILVKEVPDSDWWDDLRHKGALVRVTLKTTRKAMLRFMNEHHTHLYLIEPWKLNNDIREGIRRDAFVDEVIKQALTDEEREEVQKNAPSASQLFDYEISRVDTLTSEEKEEMRRLVRKMFEGEPEMNKREYLRKKH